MEKKGSSSPGDLNSPLLCGSDSSGCLLVADHWNHRLQILNVQDPVQPMWNVLDIDVAVQQPLSASIVEDGKLFIAGVNPNKLYMCSWQP